MTKVSSNQALNAILTLEDDNASSSTERERSPNKPAPPLLDQRVDLFLRATLGSKKSFTAEQRAAARTRILSTMATELFGPADDGLMMEEPIRRWASSNNARQANRASGTLTSFIELLRDALLFPLMGVAHTGRQARFVTASLAALLIVGGAWSTTWFYVANSAQTTLASWVASEAQSGRTYECGTRTVHGFPLRVEISCADPKATLAASEQSKIIVNAKQLNAVASLFQPHTLTTEITGPISVSQHGQPAKFVGNWALAQAKIRGTANDLKAISVVLDGAQFYRVSQISMQPILTGDRLEIDARPNAASTAGKPAFDIAAHLVGASVPEGGPIVSQNFAADISAVLHDVGSPTPMALLARLQEWQANGGRVDVIAATFQQGDTSATAQGTLSLARNGGIDGALKFTTGNLDRVAELLSGNGLQGQDGKRIAQSPDLNDKQSVVRSISPNEDSDLQRKNQQGDRRADQAPMQPGAMPAIRFSNGNAYFGSVSLGRIPPLF